MRILITNDDGIAAEGLARLVVAATEAFASRRPRVIVVAPSDPHSGCGHRVTTDRVLAVTPHGSDRHAVAGTPADCVRLALAGLVEGVDLVLSGVNAGGNLGVDIHHSGTVAAAREAAIHGVPAIAVSQYRRRGAPIDWEASARWTSETLLGLTVAGPLPLGEFWNVNLPHPETVLAGAPPRVECPVDPSPMHLSYRLERDGWWYEANYHGRPRLPGHDVAECFGGAITLSRLRSV
ncbi:MAG: 5'/3'-nucleotidase SurE [Planctomycetaceae bacterium]